MSVLILLIDIFWGFSFSFHHGEAETAGQAKVILCFLWDEEECEEVRGGAGRRGYLLATSASASSAKREPAQKKTGICGTRFQGANSNKCDR